MRISYKVWLVGGIPIAIAAAIAVVSWLLLKEAERARLYGQAQEIVKREAPWVPLALSVVFMATRKAVKGFRMDPLGRIPFEAVDRVE